MLKMKEIKNSKVEAKNNTSLFIKSHIKILRTSNYCIN